jgi:branched-chain amino acid transport system permease protein
VPSLTLLGQSVLSGIFLGALYGLLGLGLTLSWGLLRQINLAHFALVFLGAYLSFQLAGSGMDPLVTLAIVAPAFFVLGVLLQMLLARFAVKPLNTLLVTFGFMVMIESLIQWIWTADFRRLETHYGNVRWKVGELYVPFPELLTLLVAAALACGIWALLRYTTLGRAIRAAAEDGPVAAAFGVNEKALALVLAGVCAALAAVAGVLLALSHTLAPAQIYAWIGVVFAVVIIGGLGNPLGPLVAGILIGVSEAITMTLTAPAWAPLVSFTLLLAILLLKPGRVG